MLKKTLLVGGLCLSCLITALPASAQEPATLVLRTGERISGELLDLGGVGFTMRVNGQERQVDQAQVAAVEFGGAPAPAMQRAKVLSNEAGRAHVVLRNGEIIEGSLSDIGGTHPLRVTVQTSNGQRDFTSNDVAHIYYANSGAVATTGQVADENPAGNLRVEANRDWTDTGITVRRGERLMINPNGNINLGPGLSAGVNGTSAVTGNNYPVKSAAAGTLIGRVGNGAPFVIGSQTEVTVPDNGRLYLGVNDDNHADNNGFFSVGIARQPSAIRRR